MKLICLVIFCVFCCFASSQGQGFHEKLTILDDLSAESHRINQHQAPLYCDSRYTYRFSSFVNEFQQIDVTQFSWNTAGNVVGTLRISNDVDLLGYPMRYGTSTTYDQGGKVIEHSGWNSSSYGSSQEITQTFGTMGKVATWSRIISSNRGPVGSPPFRDSIRFLYEGNNLTSIEHLNSKDYNPVLSPFRQFSHFNFDSLSRISAFVYRSAEPSWFVGVNGIEWALGYAPHSLEIPEEITPASMLPYLPQLGKRLNLKPSKKLVVLYGLALNIPLERTTNQGWIGDSICLTHEATNANFQLDTTGQEVYKRDTQGRIIYYEQRTKSTTGLLLPTTVQLWTFGPNHEQTVHTEFTNLLPTGAWGDTVITKRAFEEYQSNSTRIRSIVDTIIQNGVITPYQKIVYVYSSLGLSIDNSPHPLKLQFQLIPNPNNGNFMIKGTTQDTPVAVRIMDALGRQVMQIEQQDFSTGQLSLQLNDLKAGMYFVLLSSENGVGSQRLVIR